MNAPLKTPLPLAAPTRKAPRLVLPGVAALTSLLKAVVPPLLGILLFIGVWALIATKSEGLPGPVSTWAAALELFANPFYDNGPNDMGIGWNILHSLGRVGIGFGLAALVGIPLLIPGEVFNKKIVDYLKFAREFNLQCPGFETDIHGLVEVLDVDGRKSYFADCVKA